VVPRGWWLLRRTIGIAAFVLLILAQLAAFLYVPPERTMGDVQRIFYFHVASAWNAFLAFFVVFLAGVLYLFSRRRPLDSLAAASAEVGVVFTTIVLVTGPLWAKPVWNTYWTWDVRLTTTLILWFIYVAYLAIRAAVDEPDQRARLSSIFGILGFIDVPVVFFSIRWWRSIHPVLIEPGSMNMSGPMVATLILSVVAFTVLYVYLTLYVRDWMEIKEELSEAKDRLRWTM